MPKKPPQHEPEACGSCKFFQPNDHDEAGYCRRRPPTAIYESDTTYQSVKVVTTTDEWCGEFSRRLQS
jgi:hypothetical protein